MDVEKLKVIMEAMSGLGDNAVTAFVIYLSVVYGVSLVKSILGYSVVTAAIYVIYKVVDRALTKVVD